MSAGEVKSGRKIGNGQSYGAGVATAQHLTDHRGGPAQRHVDERSRQLYRKVRLLLLRLEAISELVSTAAEQVLHGEGQLLNAGGNFEWEHGIDAVVLAVLTEGELLTRGVVKRENRVELRCAERRRFHFEQPLLPWLDCHVVAVDFAGLGDAAVDDGSLGQSGLPGVGRYYFGLVAHGEQKRRARRAGQPDGYESGLGVQIDGRFHRSGQVATGQRDFSGFAAAPP